MHALALASGAAIARLVRPPDGDAELIEEAAEYVERARERLVLDTAALAAAMMFAQTLIQTSAGGDWKLNYLIGLSLGAKLTMDSFYLHDIVEHLDSVRAKESNFWAKGGGGTRRT